MKLYYFQGKYPNFGDELNTWLLPKVFPNFLDTQDDPMFLGIGSILNDTLPKDKLKVVFGSGFGGYTSAPVVDQQWKIYCVRGPRTAAALGLDADKVAGDAAILINRYRTKPVVTKKRAAFMPHWQSPDRGHWQRACEIAGIHYIDPRGTVDQVLADIEMSAPLITEAMHGAIVADALRVPWVPTVPIFPSHRFKWYDWAEALDISLKPHSLWPTSSQEAFVKIKNRLSGRLHDPKTAWEKRLISGVDSAFTALAAVRLRSLARAEPVLSSDSALERCISKLQTQSENILRDYGRSS